MVCGPILKNQFTRMAMIEKMTRKCLAVAGLTSLLVASAFAATGTYQIDPNHSTAQFVVRHLGISNVQGDFTKVSGTVVLDDQDISKSSVNASIDVSSVDTRVQARDNDLKSANFFDVAKYPTMTFTSTKIWSTGNGTAKMTGNLTIHGVTKEVTFDVSGPTAAINAMGGMRRGVEATTKISRKDFGVTADAGLIGDEISITIDAEMVQPGAGH
jgi:polyisoprenoid-binding protein YceI